MSTSHIPAGANTIAASLNIADTESALAFYAQAFGAVKSKTFDDANGKPLHCEMKIGDSTLYFSTPMEEIGAVNAKELGGSPTLLTVYTEDVDAMFKSALGAGCEVIMPLEDYPWGDRCAIVRDPFGYRWCLATHMREVSPEEMAAAMAGCEEPSKS